MSGLGVIFDLNFVSHLNVVVIKSLKMIEFTKRTLKEFDNKFTIKAVYYHARSILEYA